MSTFAELLLANALTKAPKIATEKQAETVVEEEEEEEEEEEDIEISRGISLEDLNESDIDDDDGDILIEQHITVNNEAALKRIVENVREKDLPFSETLVVTSEEPLDLYDVHDDLARENAFYNQALAAVKVGMKEYEKAGLTFLCPATFHAPMLKSDAHMLAAHKRELEEAAAKKDSLNEQRQRELLMLQKQVKAEEQQLLKKKSALVEKDKLLKRSRAERWSSRRNGYR
ncbi:eukaryotic rRNA processing protein EBP2-domain-containing protein [Phycomyces nitens]|nr:eukaryotic rRNA processing protein EBP2-domain-containing protein [Phycomyces nitens]